MRSSECGRASSWVGPPMRSPWAVLLALLLLLAAVARPEAAHYWESNASCGLASAGFLDLGTVAQSLPSLGVCAWGFPQVLPTPPNGRTIDQCIQCMPIAAGEASCPSGYAPAAPVNGTDLWQLASTAACTQTGCLSQECPAGTLELGQPAWCSDGGAARTCCGYSDFRLCCAALQCVQLTSPVGQCVDNSNDLLPGQSVYRQKYAVTAAASDCSLYAFTLLSTCQPDLTFAPQFYDACEQLPAAPPATDAHGCAVVPGYSFQPDGSYSLPAGDQQALMDDGTPWQLLRGPAAALTAAAADVRLNAVRCSVAGLWCNWFATDDNATLRSYLPLSTTTNASSSTSSSNSSSDSSVSLCQGIYVKQAQPAPGTCPRVLGFLFKPLVSAAPLDALPTCAACWNASALAVQCSASATCVGFSHLHGLLPGPSFPPADRRAAFTTTPCFGAFQRVGGPAALPAEVETLDALLCGGGTYCDTAVEYDGSAATADGQVYLNLSVAHNLTLPLALTHPNVDTAPTLPSMPRVVSLRVTCAPGASLDGGAPMPLFLVFPNLQALALSGCGLSGPLPSEWAQLLVLGLLDVSANALTGTLPDAWSSMRLSHLNLSYNELTGVVPETWWNVLQPSESNSSNSSSSSTSSGTAQVPLQGYAHAADLGHNRLAGPLQKEYVQGVCRWADASMGLSGAGGGGLDAFASDAAGGQSGKPWWLFAGNAELEQWASPYGYAVRKASYSSDDRKYDMCGSDTYIIVLSVLWGLFFLCVLAVVAWWLLARRRAARAALKAAKAQEEEDGQRAVEGGGGAGGSRANGSHHVGDASKPREEEPAAVAAQQQRTKRRFLQWWEAMWTRRSVRRAVFLARFAWLLVDVALDISLTVWLFYNGSPTQGIVCAAFLCFVQLAIAVVAFANLVPLVFGSVCGVVLVAPIMLVVMPVLAPTLAVWNAFNPDIPLVFWRYMELVEFAVMLLQAPAESVTQSIIYSQQNQLANGMYLDHGLFIASLIFSLGDMLISIFKLMRYKHGPWRRVVVALTHLDSARDTTPYQTDIAYYSNFRPTTPLWGEEGAEGGEPLLGAELVPRQQSQLVHLHHLQQQQHRQQLEGGGGEVTANPLLAQLRHHKARKALQWGPLPRQPLIPGGVRPGGSSPGLPLAGAGRGPGLAGWAHVELGGRTASQGAATGLAGSPWSARSMPVQSKSHGHGEPDAWHVNPSATTAAPAAEAEASSSSTLSSSGGGAVGGPDGSPSPQTLGSPPPPPLPGGGSPPPAGTCEIEEQHDGPPPAPPPLPPALKDLSALDLRIPNIRMPSRRVASGHGLSVSPRGDSFGPALALPLPPGASPGASPLYTGARPSSPHASEVVGGLLRNSGRGFSLAGRRPDQPQASSPSFTSTSPPNSGALPPGRSASPLGARVAVGPRPGSASPARGMPYMQAIPARPHTAGPVAPAPLALRPPTPTSHRLATQRDASPKHASSPGAWGEGGGDARATLPFTPPLPPPPAGAAAAAGTGPSSSSAASTPTYGPAVGSSGLLTLAAQQPMPSPSGGNALPLASRFAPIPSDGSSRRHSKGAS